MNFDRVATIYDATRGLPDGVPEQVADTIVAVTDAGSETRFLELGVGTGRIAIPLIERGFPFTGVDISRQMLERLREKAGDRTNLTIVETSVTNLPLPDASQDVVLVIHVFHLIQEWQQALREVRRVLRPNGFFVWGGNTTRKTEPGQIIRKQWVEYVKEAGASLSPRYGDWEQIQAEVTEQGGWTATYRAAQWQVEFRPIDLMEAMRRQTFSASWAVPKDVLTSVHDRMLTWGRERFGDLEQPVKETEQFLVFASRFPE